jgi:NAD+ kinase
MANDSAATLKGRRIGVVLHPVRPVDEALERIDQWSRTHGMDVAGLPRDGARLPADWQRIDEADFPDAVAAVISLGGDGTMLGAMRLVADRPVPVLGVNYGHVGFLVETEPRDLDAALGMLLGGDFAIEPHHALDIAVTASEGGETEHHLAFNDAVITRMPGHGVVAAEATLGGEVFGYFKADGIIASTPAGSTAYTYSAGGPIVSPGVMATVITPVAPMAGISRALVLDPAHCLELSVTAPTRQAALEIDGNLVAQLGTGAALEISLRTGAGSVVRLDPRRHVTSGLIKLGLMDLPLTRSQMQELLPEDIEERLKARTDHLRS